MPELLFDVRWPDGKTQSYYSPSTSIADHFTPGTGYPLADFMRRARDAMHHASERVRMKYGYTCSSALDTLRQLETTAAEFDAADAMVTVLTLRSPP